MIIDGKAIAAKIIAELKSRGRLFSESKVIGFLAGSSLASRSFLREKKRVAISLGIDFTIKKIIAPITEDELLTKVHKLASDSKVVGATMQLPILIDDIDIQGALNAVPYEKDIDCLGEQRAQEFYANPTTARIAPPAVGATKSILAHVGILDIHGKRITIYGLGRLIGKPISAWVNSCGAEMTMLRRSSTSTEITAAITSAEIIITGVGITNLINISDIQPGTIVMDFGYPADIDYIAAHAKGAIVTPTPAGTGPVLVAELFRNLFTITIGDRHM